MKISLAELAKQFDLIAVGNFNQIVSNVATLENSQSHHISFLSNPKYANLLETTNAGIVIVSEDYKKHHGNHLIAKDPYVAFAKISALFQKRNKTYLGIHPTALIAKTSTINKNVSIGPYTIIGENTIIEQNTVIEARVTIGDNCKVGSDCIIKSHVVISTDCVIGNDVILHPGCIIGADGFGLARDKSGWIKVPQLGAVQIGNKCEIGANTTIDRGTLEDTILGEDVHLDNQIQIAHNVKIGDHTVMAGCSAVAGSAIIGKNCLIGGGVGILGHLKICDGVTLQSMALVTHTINKPGSYSSITPLQKTQQWRKNAVRFKSLDKIARGLIKLEKKCNER